MYLHSWTLSTTKEEKTSIASLYESERPPFIGKRSGTENYVKIMTTRVTDRLGKLLEATHDEGATENVISYPCEKTSLCRIGLQSGEDDSIENRA